MQLSLSIKASSVLYRGLSSKVNLREWARKPIIFSDDLPFKKYEHIPMMQARRMSQSTGLACEVFLEILQQQKIDAAVFLSEHGELERSHKIIEALNANNNISPTDFSMSVHNVAAGLSTILSKQTIEISSISAGPDGLAHTLYEIIAFLESGVKNVILVAFDGGTPEFYYNYGVGHEPTYAVGFLFEKGNDWQITIEAKDSEKQISGQKMPLPIQLMQGIFSDQKSFSLKGNRQFLHWKYNV